jgi:flagellar biosynthesis/type III secretory pathway M-ring protein FliF/YscJ
VAITVRKVPPALRSLGIAMMVTGLMAMAFLSFFQTLNFNPTIKTLFPVGSTADAERVGDRVLKQNILI